MEKKHAYLPVLAGILISFIFGFSFLFSKNSLETMTPFELLAHRFTLASILLLLLLLFKIIKIRFSMTLIRDLFPLACFQPLLYFIGETYGIKLTTASESGLIISLIPVAVTFMGIYYLKEKINARQWMLIFSSILGVFIIIFTGKYKFGVHALGIVCLLIAVIAAAAYNILSRKLSSKYTPIEITVVMMLNGSIIFNLIRLIINGPSENYFKAFWNAETLISLVYLGLLSSIGAFFLMNYMLNRMPAYKVATFVNLTTIVSVIAGVIVRGEQFGVLHLIGGVFIILGVWGLNSQKLGIKATEKSPIIS